MPSYKICKVFFNFFIKSVDIRCLMTYYTSVLKKSTNKNNKINEADASTKEKQP